MIKISIIVPFYNTPVTNFRQCLKALKKLNAYEVLLVDDCSSDIRAVEVAKQSGFRYLKTPYQSGRDGLGFKIGVENAKGDYICRMDSDDILLSLPTIMSAKVHFSRITRVVKPDNITLEKLILAPRAVINGLVIDRELILTFNLFTDKYIFHDILIAIIILHRGYKYTINKDTNYIYKKVSTSLQKSSSPLFHRLTHIQTVARFCQVENLSSELSIKYMNMAMLNLKYGSKSVNFLNKSIDS